MKYLLARRVGIAGYRSGMFGKFIESDYALVAGEFISLNPGADPVLIVSAFLNADGIKVLVLDDAEYDDEDCRGWSDEERARQWVYHTSGWHSVDEFELSWPPDRERPDGAHHRRSDRHGGWSAWLEDRAHEVWDGDAAATAVMRLLRGERYLHRAHRGGLRSGAPGAAVLPAEAGRRVPGLRRRREVRRAERGRGVREVRRQWDSGLRLRLDLDVAQIPLP